MFPLFLRLSTSLLRSCAADNIKMTRLLTEALAEPLEIIESRYEPLLWSVDRLGRTVNVAGSGKMLPASLRQLGFRLISACYGAGYTYKWSRGCQYPAESPVLVSSPCLVEIVSHALF